MFRNTVHEIKWKILVNTYHGGHFSPDSLCPATLASAQCTLKVGHVPVANVLQRLGAKLEQGCAAKELDSYSSHFDRTDPDRDGKHTRAEYVDKGSYMTPQARAGIFRAADGNDDGALTQEEFAKNRNRRLPTGERSGRQKQ